MGDCGCLVAPSANKHLLSIHIVRGIWLKPWASQVALVVKNLPANAGDMRDMGSIPGWGSSPGGWHRNPLQCSCWRIRWKKEQRAYSSKESDTTGATQLAHAHTPEMQSLRPGSCTKELKISCRASQPVGQRGFRCSRIPTSPSKWPGYSYR